MASTGQVGVVVPVWKRARTVLRSLASVANQTLAANRVIVVDDGSVDGTAASVMEWLARRQPGDGWQLIRQPHRGVASARNRGLAELDGCEFVTFLDSDDLWPRRFLQRSVARLAGVPAAVAASADRRMVNVRRKSTRFDDLHAVAENATSWIFAHDAGICSSTVMRHSAVTELGGFDESLPLWEDGDLLLRLSLLGPWLYVPRTPVTFTEGASTVRGEQSNLKRSYVNRQSRWAMMREAIAADAAFAARLSPEIVRDALVRRWRSAANESLRRLRFVGWLNCRRRADQWRRGAVRPRLGAAHMTANRAA